MYEGEAVPAQALPVVFGGFGRRLGAALLDSLVWLIAIGWFLGAFPEKFFDDHPVAGPANLFPPPPWGGRRNSLRALHSLVQLLRDLRVARGTDDRQERSRPARSAGRRR